MVGRVQKSKASARGSSKGSAAGRSRSRSQSKPRVKAAQKTHSPHKPAKTQVHKPAAIDFDEMLEACSAAKPRASSASKKAQSPAPKKVQTKAPVAKKQHQSIDIGLDEMLGASASKPKVQTQKAQPSKSPAKSAATKGQCCPHGDKILHLMGRLRARDSSDARQNAEVLSEIIRSFSSQKISTKDILDCTTHKKK